MHAEASLASLIEPALRPCSVRDGKPALRLCLGLDQIAERFGLEKIELSIQKRALCELARLGMPHTGEMPTKLFKDGGNNRAAAMKMKLGAILSGKAGRPRKEQHQTAIQR